MRSGLSKLGAHADLQAALSERWHGSGSTAQFDYFQRPPEQIKFRSYFFQILGTNHYCLTEFVSISRDRGEHVAEILGDLGRWSHEAMALLDRLQDQIPSETC
jgi:hypothetical protein